MLIVVDPPRFDLHLRVVERCELVHVQALVAEAPVERFNEGILNGLARTNEIESGLQALNGRREDLP